MISFVPNGGPESHKEPPKAHQEPRPWNDPLGQTLLPLASLPAFDIARSQSQLSPAETKQFGVLLLHVQTQRFGFERLTASIMNRHASNMTHSKVKSICTKEKWSESDLNPKS